MESDYFYCLQADYAIRKRLNFDCFGDGAVYDGIQKALNESKENFHKFAKKLRTEMCRLRFPQLKAIMNLMQGQI